MMPDIKPKDTKCTDVARWNKYLFDVTCFITTTANTHSINLNYLLPLKIKVNACNIHSKRINTATMSWIITDKNANTNWIVVFRVWLKYTKYRIEIEI